jgi:hypothetical protein
MDKTSEIFGSFIFSKSVKFLSMNKNEKIRQLFCNLKFCLNFGEKNEKEKFFIRDWC